MALVQQKRAVRNLNSVDMLKIEDRLCRTAAAKICHMFTRPERALNNDWGPVERAAAYYERKKALIRAAYWQQRYGREYYKDRVYPGTPW